ncbi:MAG: FecR family protein [Bacteroidota bacterium]|nr:FecR family protein [Bacteroidota bacterium]
MKTINIFLALVILTASVTFGMQSGNSPLAVVTKVINSVDKKNPESDWKKIIKGDPLKIKELVRTGLKSVAIIKFTDKSIIRLLENSELEMLGGKQPKQTLNDMKLQKGSIGFTITKKQNEQYTFSSPTSVASIRGTKGKFHSQDELDILIVTEGIVNLKNLISGKDTDVGSNQIGFSHPDGKLEVRDATPDEIAGCEESLKAGDVRKKNEMQLELRDSDGNKRNLKIDYQE